MSVANYWVEYFDENKKAKEALDCEDESGAIAVAWLMIIQNYSHVKVVNSMGEPEYDERQVCKKIDINNPDVQEIFRRVSSGVTIH